MALLEFDETQQAHIKVIGVGGGGGNAGADRPTTVGTATRSQECTGLSERL